jgi:hypothetical protein
VFQRRSWRLAPLLLHRTPHNMTMAETTYRTLGPDNDWREVSDLCASLTSPTCPVTEISLYGWDSECVNGVGFALPLWSRTVPQSFGHDTAYRRAKLVGSSARTHKRSVASISALSCLKPIFARSEFELRRRLRDSNGSTFWGNGSESRYFRG